MINCEGPIVHVLKYLGVRDKGCLHRGCDPLTLVQKKLWKTYGKKRKKCEFRAHLWNNQICLIHCRNYRRLEKNSDIRRWLNSTISSRRNYIHASTVKDSKFFQKFFNVKQTCCSGKGFKPYSARLALDYNGGVAQLRS